MAENDRKYTGVEPATFIQNQLNVKFGDERYFDLTTASSNTFKVNFTSGGATSVVDIDLSTTFNTDALKLDGHYGSWSPLFKLNWIQQLASGLGAGKVTVSYDYAAREFLFKPARPTPSH